MRFVANDQIPVGLLQFFLQFVIAAELVEPAEDEIRFFEPVATCRRFDLLPRQDLEAQIELGLKLILPLFDQAPGTDDHASAQVTPQPQFLDEQSCHDRLAGAGIVGKKESQGLPGQHLLIDGRQLMRERLNIRAVYGEERIEEVGELDALRLRNQTQELAVAIETPGAAVLLDSQVRLGITIQQARPSSARIVPVGHGRRRRPEPLHLDDGHQAARLDPRHDRSLREFFEPNHVLVPPIDYQ